jgi:hypothetical protein
MKMDLGCHELKHPTSFFSAEKWVPYHFVLDDLILRAEQQNAFRKKSHTFDVMFIQMKPLKLGNSSRFEYDDSSDDIPNDLGIFRDSPVEKENKFSGDDLAQSSLISQPLCRAS